MQPKNKTTATPPPIPPKSIPPPSFARFVARRNNQQPSPKYFRGIGKHSAFTFLAILVCFVLGVFLRESLMLGLGIFIVCLYIAIKILLPNKDSEDFDHNRKDMYIDQAISSLQKNDFSGAEKAMINARKYGGLSKAQEAQLMAIHKRCEQERLSSK